MKIYNSIWYVKKNVHIAPLLTFLFYKKKYLIHRLRSYYFVRVASVYLDKCHIKYDDFSRPLMRINFPYRDLDNCIEYKCRPGFIKCANTNYCLALKHFCDGISHCENGDDEINCCKIDKKKLN